MLFQASSASPLRRLLKRDRGDRRIVTSTLATFESEGSHEHKLLCRRGVNSDGCVEIGFGRSHLERNAEALNDFWCVISNHVATEHSIGFPIN